MRVVVEYDPDVDSEVEAEKMEMVLGSLMPQLESAQVIGNEVWMANGYYYRRGSVEVVRRGVSSRRPLFTEAGIQHDGGDPS